MRLRVVLLLSVLMNVGLGALLYLSIHSLPEPPLPVAVASSDADSETNKVKTRVIVRKQFFAWSEIESDDYPTYIANLQAIGCPATTIRDIIVADVNQLYGKKQAVIAGSSEQQWWRAVPDLDELEAALDQYKALEAERRKLLTTLLGTGWDAVSYNPNLFATTPVSVDLSGPILGELSEETKTAVHEIIGRAQRRQENYLEAMKTAGQAPDPAELVRLQRQTRADLAALLTAPQLEEYLLRYSQTANTLRQQMAGFDANADEFRKAFALRDPIDQQIAEFTGKTDAASVKKVQELELARETALKQSLGAERYKMYQMMTDPAFRDAKSTAEQYGAAADLVMPIYQVNQLALAEQQRIKNDPTLTIDEREDALDSLRAQKNKSVRMILDRKTPPPETPPASTPSQYPPVPWQLQLSPPVPTGP